MAAIVRKSLCSISEMYPVVMIKRGLLPKDSLSELVLFSITWSLQTQILTYNYTRRFKNKVFLCLSDSSKQFFSVGGVTRSGHSSDPTITFQDARFATFSFKCKPIQSLNI